MFAILSISMCVKARVGPLAEPVPYAVPDILQRVRYHSEGVSPVNEKKVLDAPAGLQPGVTVAMVHNRFSWGLSLVVSGLYAGFI